MLEKVIHPCDVPQWDGKKWPVFCKIEISDDGRLSITGVIGPNHYGNAKGGCGQIDSEFDHQDKSENDARYDHPIKSSELRFAPGWNRAKWYEFLHIWKVWHLNDMQPACEHQRALGWDKEPIDPTRPTTDYDKFDGHSSSWNLKGWVYPPLGHLTEPCPVCGYKYGSAWLTVELPTDVIEFLQSLPDTDRKPAWV